MLLYFGIAAFILLIVALSEGWIFPLPDHPWSASVDPRGFVQQATKEGRIE